MKYQNSGVKIEITHGTGPGPDYVSGYFVRVTHLGTREAVHQVEGREAELLGLLLEGEKLKKFVQTSDISGMFRSQ